MNKLVIYFSICIFSFFLLRGITLPYVGPNATNFAVYSLIAHNFNTFGYSTTKFTPIISIAKTFPEKPEYFFHHPTLLSVNESLFFRIFGEDFWVGRFSVIIFASGSFLLIYLIGKKLLSKKLAVISIFIYSLIPASTLFGKMIGQEPLVLFFCLSMFYSVKQYLQTKKNLFLILSTFAILFGVLSDWPMVIFPFCFLLLFVRYKKISKGIFLCLSSICITSLLIMYIAFMQQGFWDLKFGVYHRSISGLLSLGINPFQWLTTIFLRLVLYFNPFFTFLSCVWLYNFYKNYKQKKLTEIDFIIFGFFLFALIHAFLYAEAVFTHPYLMYYSLPFITFSSSVMLYKKLTQPKFITIIFILSFLHLLAIQIYKSNQISSNIWRYDVAKEVSKHINRYERVLVNGSSVIDTDLLWYPFLINVDSAGEKVPKNMNNYRHFIYSCIEKCITNNAHIAFLKRNYSYIYIAHPEAEAYIFSLENKEGKMMQEIQMKNSKSGNYKNYELIRKIYRLLQNILKAPQI